VYGNAMASTNRNRGILNAMMRRACAGEPITLYGDGHYVRDFIHVDDVAGAFQCALAEQEVCDGTAYVAATGVGAPPAAALQLIAVESERLTGRKVEIRHVPEPGDLHPIERRNFVGNAARFRGKTQWRPRIALLDGIRRSLKELPSNVTAG